jgi:periplasmic protein TonB
MREQSASMPWLTGIDPDTRPAPPPAPISRVRLAMVLTASLALHAGAVAAFRREAPPFASVGIESISVEIVLGTDRLAGLSMQPVVAESTVDAVAAKGEGPQLVKPETARSEVKAAETVKQAKATTVTELPPQPRAQSPTEAKPVVRQESVPVLASAVASTDAAMPRPRPDQPVAGKPPEARAVTAPPKRRTAVRQKKDKGEDTRTRESTNSMASVASSGIGRGRSDAVSNYRGIIQAQLMRHLHFPPDAKRDGQEGTAIVRFVIEPSGKVTRATLVRGTGVASLDREALALVHRAAPFPPPPSPDGFRPTVPINFNIQ